MSPACCTRSGEPATSFAPRLPGTVRRGGARLSASFDRLPIRVRLAGVSALLTFVILCGFAVTVGSLTVRRIRSDFNREVADTASQLPSQLSIKVNPNTFQIVGIEPPLQDLAESDSAVIRILSLGGGVIAETANAPSLGAASPQPQNVNGYRVLSHPASVYLQGTGQQEGQVFVQYGRSVADTEAMLPSPIFAAPWCHVWLQHHPPD